EVLSAPRSPWQRAYVERVIGSIRRECLDHVIVFNEESLRRTLRSYFSYYHRSRLHLSLDKDSPGAPCNRSAESSLFPKLVGCIIATNARPETVSRKFSERRRKTHEYFGRTNGRSRDGVQYFKRSWLVNGPPGPCTEVPLFKRSLMRFSVTTDA